MERLRLVLIIAACFATAPTSAAQRSPTPGLNSSPVTAQASFVVIGDVKNFNYFPLSSTHRTTLREAVLNAGIFTASANVSVLRGTHDRTLWTQVISADSTDFGEFVMNGDVLIVQSLTPIAEPFQKCAALRTDAGAIIVALADETVAIGDVLQQTNTSPAAGQQLKIVSRLHGRPTVANALMSDKVIHGDVIALTFSSGNGLPRFGGMAPSFSEWQENAGSIPAATPAVEPAPLNIEAPNVPSEASVESSFRIPASLDSTQVAADARLPADSPFPDQFVESGPSAREAALEVLAVSQSSPFPDVTAQSAPVPPVEVPLSAAPSSVSSEISPWNLVFIGGLLVAGTLILAGSLRSDDESAAEPVAQPAQRQYLQSFDFIRSEPGAAQTTAITTHATQTPRAAEWKATAAGTRLIAEETIAEKALEEAVGPRNMPPGNPVAATEWFGGEWRTGQQPVTDFSNLIADNSALNVIADLPSREQFSDLEDLVQNRLPIDLCETRLPLRISLFGRPAGPRRLRIDAAHTQLAGPHSNVAANRKREDSTVLGVSETASGNQPNVSGGDLDRALHSLLERTDS